MTLTTLLVVAQLLVGPPMPDRSNLMTQTKRDIVFLQVGGWACGSQSDAIKKCYVEKLLKSWKRLRSTDCNTRRRRRRRRTVYCHTSLSTAF
jgi:hypothetical protein